MADSAILDNTRLYYGRHVDSSLATQEATRTFKPFQSDEPPEMKLRRRAQEEREWGQHIYVRVHPPRCGIATSAAVHTHTLTLEERRMRSRGVSLCHWLSQEKSLTPRSTFGTSLKW